MKRVLSLLCVYACFSCAQAQTYVGYNYGNYNGVISATFNPANIANSQYKFDINLFSINALAGTNAYSFNSKSLWKFNFGKLKDSVDFFKNTDSKDKNAWTNIDILAPSFMVNLGKKGGAFAITTRSRLLINEDNLNNDIFQSLIQGETEFIGKKYTQDNFKMDAHGFGEIGLTYARTLWQNEKNLLSGGATAKYLMGAASGSARMDSLNLEMVSEETLKEIRGNVSMLYSKGIDNLVGDSNMSWTDALDDRGVGFDLGVTYEWRPKGNTQYFETRDINENSHWLNKERTSYKLKAGISVTDIGKIKYTTTENAKSYRLNALNFKKEDLEPADGETMDDYINRLQNLSSNDALGKVLTELPQSESYDVSLPTMLHANVDWQAYKSIFVNMNADVNMVGKNSKGAHYVNNYTVTPRFEHRWFTLYSPVSYNERTKLNWGVGLNLGALYIGSGSVLTGLMKKEINSIDVHAGLHIPIYKSKAKKNKTVEYTPPPVQVVAKPVDTDGDGVNDNEDKCPNVAGLAKYQGCPIPDTDGDGVNDESDKCPNVAGLAKYQGCPIPDTDGDGVNDEADKCPNVKGVVKYQGCPIPDTDGDGVNDEVDKCPKIPGTAANFGCPEIKKEVIEKVKYSASKIQFATGSDKLLSTSYPALNTICKLMEASPELQLNVEGHTDNVGKPAFNQTLSEKRAASVKKYITLKGIADERVETKGFGPDSPIAPNTTSAGKAKNRRVELKLHY